MTQRDIAVQTDPPETAVTAALRVYAGLHDWAVVHTTDGQHAHASLHYVGRAVDLAARAGPGADTSALLAINELIVQTLPLSMISELIYAGPGAVCVHNGKVVAGLAVYGADVMAEHHNHVHLGVIPTFTYQGSREVVAAMADDPNLPNIAGPVMFAVAGQDADGKATGYYIFSQKTGELHAFGPGAVFFGRSEVTS